MTNSQEYSLPIVSIIMYSPRGLSRTLCGVRRHIHAKASDRWLYCGDSCGIISLTDRTEFTLHIIGAVLRLNAPNPRGLLHGTNFFRKPRRERDLPQLGRSSLVESHTGGLFCRGNRPFVHRCILYVPEFEIRGQREDERDV